MIIIILEASLGYIPTVVPRSLQLPTAAVPKHSSHQALFDSDMVVVELNMRPIIMSETWTCAPDLCERYLGSGYSKQLDSNIETSLPRGRATLLADLNENRLLPTNVGPLLRYRTTHRQDKKYQHQADRSRKGEDVKVGQ